MAKTQRVAYIAWIVRKIRKRIPLLLFKTLLCAAISFAAVQFSLTTKSVVNSAISGDRSALRISCAVMIGLSLFRLLGNTLVQFVGYDLNEKLERDFKRSILRDILRSDYAYISRHHSGDLLQRMNGDAAAVYNGVTGLFGSLTSLVTSLAAAITALMQIAPEFTLFFGAAGILVASAALLCKRLLKQLSKDGSAANGRVGGFLHETVSKLMVIQALDLSREVERRTDDVLDYRWSVRRRQRNVHSISQFGISLISAAAYLATMLWCAGKLYAGEITYGDVTAMVALVGTVQSSAMSLPQMLPRFISISASCDRIMELEALPRQPDPDPVSARALYSELTGFTAKHLTFSYDREPVMQDVSLTIPKGGLSVIIGQSGIGKSTLLKLLLGLYRPDSGSLTVDLPEGPIPVDRSTRSLFSYAPQGNFLLSGTLRENLTFTNPDATEAEIRSALYVSAMDEYVASLPDGLDTVLLENGAGLSEGQAQRLSLARAILSGAPVLLLDEVTSALDSQTEQTVLERICALPGKTCIAVTHRPAALALADNIIEVTENCMVLRTVQTCGSSKQ